MKPSLLTLSLLLALNGAVAAEPAARAAPAAQPAAAAHAQASAAPEAPLDAEASAEARAELGELRTQIGELSRRMAELSVKLGDVGPRAYAFRYLNEPDRAIIGVVLAADDDGARIDALTPDSPAERAGLRSGDIITRIDGHALDTKNARIALDDARKRLADLKDGEEVRIGYSRDGKPGKDLTLKAQRREALSWPRLIAGDGEDGRRVLQLDKEVDIDVRQAIGEARSDAQRARADALRSRASAERSMQRAEIVRMESLRHAMPWWGISLAALNDDLGRYFGSDRGVLVLSTHADTLPELKAGDVIRKVDGEAVARPEEALRALRDQPAGSMVDLDVLRDRKALALKVKVPEYKSIFSVGRTAPLPPLPPTPPTPATAPNPPATPHPASTPDAPAPPRAPLPPVAGATTVAFADDIDVRSAMVSPEVARNGASAGAPALWGGEIIDTKMRGGNHCARVRSHRLDASGKPVRGFASNTSFLACGTDSLDATQFRTGEFATFAGHVQAVDDDRRGTAMPVLRISDAKAWKPMPTQGLPPPTPTSIPAAGH